jgi:hypothetical protein
MTTAKTLGGADTAWARRRTRDAEDRQEKEKKSTPPPPQQIPCHHYAKYCIQKRYFTLFHITLLSNYITEQQDSTQNIHTYTNLRNTHATQQTNRADSAKNHPGPAKNYTDSAQIGADSARNHTDPA